MYVQTPSEEKDELDLVFYELQMLTQMRRLANENTIEGVGCLESFLLHARNLIDFLENPRKKNTKKDDLLCSDFDNQSGDKISPILTGLDCSLKVKINKHLSHLTTTRKDERIHWAVEMIERPILQKLTLFLDQLADIYFPTKRNKGKSDFTNLM